MSRLRNGVNEFFGLDFTRVLHDNKPRGSQMFLKISSLPPR